MTDDYAGQMVANVITLREKSYEALPGILACCHDNPSIGNDEFEDVLLVIHAQTMFRRNHTVIERLLSAEALHLSAEEAVALTWLRNATECFADSIERMRERDQLWVPDTVRKALVPFTGELPF